MWSKHAFRLLALVVTLAFAHLGAEAATLTAPTSLTASAVSTSQINLTWVDTTNTETGFQVERSLSATSGFALIATTAKSVTAYSDTTAASGTYYYRVRATDRKGATSAYSNVASASTSPPTGSVLINGNAGYTRSTAVTLTLSATDAVGVTGYYLSTSATAPILATPGWVTVTSTLSYSSSVAYTLSTGDGTKTVYAWYRNGAGLISATASDSIVLDATSPSNGTVTATAGSGQVALSWAGFSDATSGLASTNTYKLVYATGGFPASSCTTGTQLLLGTATSFTHTALTNGTTYYYRVCAFDNAGNMSTGATASAMPGGAPTGSVLINGNAAYTRLTAVTLALSATDAVGVTGYYLSTTATAPTLATAGWVTVTSTLSYSSSVAYTLSSGDGTKTVYAWYRNGAGLISAAASDFIVLDQTPPTNGSLTATAGDAQVSLSWAGFADTTSGLATANTYKLVYALGGFPASSCTTGTQLLLGTATSFTHTTLTNGTTYYYRVCASDNAGNSSTGATASAVPQAAAAFNPTLVGFVPGVGDAKAVAVAGGLAYVASDPFGLSVANVTNPAAPVITGASDVPFFGHSIAVSGIRGVVGGKGPDGTAHLWVLDLTDSTRPRVLGELATTVPVTTSGNGYMGVALNGTGTRAVMALGATGIRVVDLTNPAAPNPLGTYNTPGTAYAVTLDSTGTLAYVADGIGHLQIVNISTPSLPTLAGSLSLSGNQVDLALAGSLVYLVSVTGSIDVVDVSNPSGPLRIGGMPSGLSGAAIHVAVSGTVATVVSTASTGDFLDVLNLSNPALPVRTASVLLGAPGTGKGVALAGGLAYVAANAAGLQIYDVGTPTPVGQGVVNDSFEPRAIAVSGAVAAVSGKYIPTQTARLQVLAVTDPTRPLVLGELATTVPVTTSGNGYMGVALNGTATRAVMALGATGIRVVDLTNPAAPSPLGTYNTPGTAYAVTLNSTGTLAYVADGIGHLQIVNISTPSLPTLAGSLSLSGNQVDLALAGTLVYLVSVTGSIDVVDVTNPGGPLRIGGMPSGLSGAAIHVAVSGTVAAVVSTASTGDFLDVLSLSNPALPVLTASVLLGPPGTGKGVALAGGLAYVAANAAGLQIYDVTTPSNPVPLGTVDTVGDALDVRVQSGFAYVADFPATIDIIDLVP